ncbi:DUF4129 domain-containing protein [Tabrizicola sp.]|uniref:DUF4129 domain-containing protein n=1 Tax=Tabrizicola sp. TaxID=2005166 RepID=UPI003F676257
MEIGPSGEAYLESVRYSSNQTDVAYFDPRGPAPRLETGQDPVPPPKPGADGQAEQLSTVQIVVIVVATAVLIGLAMLVRRFAGGFTLSLQGEAQNAARARRAGGGGAMAKAGPPADLQAILGTADRRRALVMLAQAALARTVTANGVLLQPSWTMRDTLRRIPKTQAHLDALRGLVMKGEQVLFGNRDVTEAEFQAQVATIRPLMAGASA